MQNEITCQWPNASCYFSKKKDYSIQFKYILFTYVQ